MKHYHGIAKCTPCDLALVCCCLLESNSTEQWHLVLHIEISNNSVQYLPHKYITGFVEVYKTAEVQGLHESNNFFPVGPFTLWCCCSFIYSTILGIQFGSLVVKMASYTTDPYLSKYKLHSPYIITLVCKKDRNNGDITATGFHVTSFHQQLD